MGSGKSMDLVIGAKIGESITQLKKDIAKLEDRLTIKIKKIELGSQAISSLQSQIQAAISSKKYTISLDPSGAEAQARKVAEATERVISQSRADTLYSNFSNLNTKNYLKDMQTLNIPTQKIEAFRQKLEAAREAYRELFETKGRNFEGINVSDAERLATLYKEIEVSYRALKAGGAQEDPITQKEINELELYDNKLREAYLAVERLQTLGVGNIVPADTLSQIQALQERIQSLYMFDSVKVGEGGSQEIREITKSADELLNRLRTISGISLTPKGADGFSRELDTASKKVDNLLAKYKDLQAQDPTAYNTLKGFSNRFATGRASITPQELADMNTQIAEMEANFVRAGYGVDDLSKRIKSRLIPQLGRMAISYGIMALRRGFRQMVTDIKEVDKAMTELRKVTDLTAAAYDSFLKRASQSSVVLGAKIDDYVNAVADFARLGYSVSDSEMLAKTATVYKNVGDGIESVAAASESVISTMKAFGIEANHSMDIVDAFNEVGNNFAISSTGIGTALKNSAAALATANNSLSESIGLVVAGNDVVQDPAKVGTALKTISMFLRAAKTEAEEAGESTEGMASSVSKLRDQLLQLTGGHVDIMLDDSTFKSTYQILKELSEVWGSLADVDQANILEKIGGKRQANVVTSILNNFKDAEAVLKTIENDEGSAMKEQEKWLNSVEGRLGQLKSTAQQFAIDIINTESVKNAIVGLTKIVGFIDKIVGHKGGIMQVVTALTAFSMIFRANSVWMGLTKVIEGLQKFKLAKAGIIGVVNALRASKTAATTAAVATKAEGAALDGMAASATAASVAAGTLTAVLTGITVLAAGFALGYSIYKGHQDKLKQQAEDAKQAFEETSETIDSYTEKIKEARQALDEATTVEARTEKTAELRDIEKELVDLYGAQANGIDLVNGKLDTQLEKLDKITKKKALDVLEKNGGQVADAMEKYTSTSTTVTGMRWSDNGGKVKRFLQERGVKISNSRPEGSPYDLVTIEGEYNARKKAITDLYAYMTMHQGEFDKGVQKGIKKLYHELTDGADEFESQIKTSANAQLALLDLTKSSDKEVYRNYQGFEKELDNFKTLIAEGDWNAAGASQKFLEQFISAIEDKVPVIAQYMKNLMFAATGGSNIDLIIRLKEDNFELSDLARRLSRFKNENGTINIDLLTKGDKKSKRVMQQLDVTAQHYGTTVKGLVDAINTLNETDMSGIAGVSERIGNVVGQAQTLSSMESDFEVIKKIYEDVSNGDTFDYSSVVGGDFEAKFGDLGDAYTEFQETILKTPNDIAKCQAAFDKLTQEYIEQKGILKGLTEENKNVAIAQLKQIGVTNAEEVVNSHLNRTLTISEEQYRSLCTALGETIEATQLSSGAYKIEASTMRDLGISAEDMAYVIALAQTSATEVTIKGAMQRISALKKEAEVYSDYYGALKKSYTTAQETLPAGTNEFNTNRYAAYLASQEAKANGYKTAGANVNDLLEFAKIESEAEAALAELSGLSAPSYTPRGGSSGSGSGGSGSGDPYLDAWQEKVEKKKALLENDKMTTEQYYDWLRKAYKSSGGLADTPAHRETYAKQIKEIESELYQWEKDSIQQKIDDQDALLKNQRANGLISEAEYQKKLGKITEEGYKDLLKKVKDKELYGVDETERLEAETELLEKVKDEHIAAFEAEVSELDHLRALELITEEQYYAQRAALTAEYYGKEEMYRDELKKEEEELFKERTDLIKKYASAAKEAVSSIMDAGKSMADAVGDLVQGIIDANSSNFDLQKNLLKHQLEMNYITEEEYYKKLEVLYKTYYKSKSIYLDEYWENQEEIYNFEMETMENGASALEDIHAKVVDLIKQELEDAKDAIEETKESYTKLIDIRRKALEEEKDENDTEKSRVEKLNEIAELTRQLNALRNDNSAEGQRRYKEVFAKLIEARKKLQDFEEEQAYKAATAQLDREAESLDKQSEDATKELDDKLNDNEWLVDEAWRRLRGMNESLYNELVDYAKKHSTSIKDDVTGSWETASSAFEKYKDDVKAGYGEISQILAHPETYYPGIDSAEAAYDAELTKQKEMENYAEVLGEFAEQIADIMGASVQSVAGILNTLFPGYITDLLVDGADIFSDSLGMVGINNSLLSTVAALGGIAGIMDMMNGFQSLAEGGGEYNGIAIGGENINSILGMLQSIQDYGVGIGASNNATNDLLGLVITAIGNGAGEGSSVVTGIGTIAALATGLLTVGTTLLGGGGTGMSTLFTALGTIGSLIGASNSIGSKSDDCLVRLLNVLTKVCEYNADFVNSNESLGVEVSGLRTVLYNSWKLVYNLLEQRLGSSGNMGMLGGLVGSLAGSILSGNSGTYTRLVNDETGIASVLSDNLIKVLGNSNLLGGGVISKLVDIGMSSIPSSTINNNNTVTVNPTFQIRSNDPEGVVSAIEGIMPRIADYTISVLLNGTDNKGVKRSVTSLA